MAAETASGYIQHHLQNLTTVNYQTAAGALPIRLQKPRQWASGRSTWTPWVGPSRWV